MPGSRVKGTAAGRHAGKRLLSTLDGGLEPPAAFGSADAEPFVLPDLPHFPARTEPRRFPSTIRFRTGFRAACLIGALCLLGTGGFWWHALAGRTDVAAVGHTGPEYREKDYESQQPPAAPTSSGAGEPLPLPEGTAADLEPSAIVHVAGAVNSPGVVTLPAGSRVNDALAAAGGPAAVSDPGMLNLAALVTDGQRIFVPRPGEELPGEPPKAPTANPPAPASGGKATGAAEAKVNLNTATPAELATLPRVGPVLAQNIIEWRLEHGPFSTTEELDAVEGIGPKMLETLLPLVTL